MIFFSIYRIDSWAEKFGLELKELSTTLAKTTEIKEVN